MSPRATRRALLPSRLLTRGTRQMASGEECESAAAPSVPVLAAGFFDGSVNGRSRQRTMEYASVHPGLLCSQGWSAFDALNGEPDGSRQPGPSRVCDHRHRLAGRMARLSIPLTRRWIGALRL